MILSVADGVSISSIVFCLKFGTKVQPCASARASSSSINPSTKSLTPGFSSNCVRLGVSKMTLAGWKQIGLETTVSSIAGKTAAICFRGGTLPYHPFVLLLPNIAGDFAVYLPRAQRHSKGLGHVFLYRRRDVVIPVRWANPDLG